MKMNSNNEQDYRHFKGVGASYESGVVYSHQKLVVSEGHPLSRNLLVQQVDFVSVSKRFRVSTVSQV